MRNCILMGDQKDGKYQHIFVNNQSIMLKFEIGVETLAAFVNSQMWGTKIDFKNLYFVNIIARNLQLMTA